MSCATVTTTTKRRLPEDPTVLRMDHQARSEAVTDGYTRRPLGPGSNWATDDSSIEAPWSTIVLSMLPPGACRAINRRRKSGYGITGGHKSKAELQSTIFDQAPILEPVQQSIST